MAKVRSQWALLPRQGLVAFVAPDDDAMIRGCIGSVYRFV